MSLEYLSDVFLGFVGVKTSSESEQLSRTYDIKLIKCMMCSLLQWQTVGGPSGRAGRSARVRVVRGSNRERGFATRHGLKMEAPNALETTANGSRATWAAVKASVSISLILSYFLELLSNSQWCVMVDNGALGSRLDASCYRHVCWLYRGAKE